jgi:hypothetical protein
VNNFVKKGWSEVTIAGLPFDFKSLMLYEKYASSSNGQPTVEPLDTNIDTSNMGKQTGPSALDIAKINRIYKCPQDKSMFITNG